MCMRRTRYVFIRQEGRRLFPRVHLHRAIELRQEHEHIRWSYTNMLTRRTAVGDVDLSRPLCLGGTAFHPKSDIIFGRRQFPSEILARTIKFQAAILRIEFFSWAAARACGINSAGHNIWFHVVSVAESKERPNLNICARCDHESDVGE